MSSVQYTISIVLWGGPLNPDATADENDKTKDPDFETPARHVGISLHQSIPYPETCHLHHARCPSQIHFIYDPHRDQPFFKQDPVLRGRCDLRSDLSPTELWKAEQVLAAFGADESHLPFYGEGNCHNWLAGAVGALEKAGLLQSGVAMFWDSMINKGPVVMSKSWEARGGVYVRNPTFGQGADLEADAKWKDKESVVVGRLGADRGEAVAALFADRPRVKA